MPPVILLTGAGASDDSIQLFIPVGVVCVSSALKLSLQCAITLAYAVALPTPALMLVDFLRSVLDLIWCVSLLAPGAVRLGPTLPSSVARSATSGGIGTAAL